MQDIFCVKNQFSTLVYIVYEWIADFFHSLNNSKFLLFFYDISIKNCVFLFIDSEKHLCTDRIFLLLLWLYTTTRSICFHFALNTRIFHCSRSHFHWTMRDDVEKEFSNFPFGWCLFCVYILYVIAICSRIRCYCVALFREVCTILTAVKRVFGFD